MYSNKSIHHTKIREDTNVIVLHSYLLEHENTPQLFDEDNTEVPVDQFLTNLKVLHLVGCIALITMHVPTSLIGVISYIYILL